MKLILADIENFMGIGKATLNLADKGLVAIQGVNLDDSSANSNGAGKSSLADAVFWCNFGSTARDNLGADEVINRVAGKDTQVQCVWREDDGGFYTVTRWRKKNVNGKKNGVSLTYTDPSGTEVDLTKGTDTLTQAQIDKALGCTKEVFSAAVYAGQEKLPNLPAMTDGELKQLIEKASGVDHFVAAYKVARDRLSEAQKDEDRWRMTHVRLERDVTTSQDRLQQMISQRDSFEAKRKANITMLSDTIREHVRLAKIRQQERDTVDAVRIQAEIDALDAKIEAVKGEQLEEEALAADERDASTHLTVLKANMNRAVQEAQNQKRKVDGISGRVGQPCGECGKACEEHDIDEVRKIALEQLRILVGRAKELKTDVEVQEEVVGRRVKSLTDHRTARTDVSAVVSERRRYAELLAQRKRSEDAMANETNSANRVKTQLDAEKVSENPFVAIVGSAQKELDDAAAEYRSSEEEGVKISRRIMIAKEVVKVYGPAGVRAHVLDTVTPELNSRTADYLGAMSDGNISAIWSTLSINAKGDVTEKFSITASKYSDGGSFASLSGGEKRKVRLATALALQDLVASRANKPIEFMVYDEVDTALDDAGLERLMNVFEQKGRDKGTVMIISHNDINDFVRNVATLTMKDKVSTIEAGVLAA